MVKDYFIKEGYNSRSSQDVQHWKAGGKFWTKERVMMNGFFQYHVYEYARDIIRGHKIRSVLDIGCGAGKKLMTLIHPICMEVTGVDMEEAIEYCRNAYTGGRFIVDDLENPKRPDHGPYGLLICSDVIEHMNDPDILLDYIKKMSTGESYILISTPERDVLRGKDCMGSEKPEHVREWNQDELRSYLSNEGFIVIEQKLIPFTRFAFNPDIISLWWTIKKRCGTVNTTQLVVCKLGED